MSDPTPPFDWQATLISQFANSPTLTMMVSNMAGYFDPTVNFDAFYKQIWNIDTAVGYGLDVWGRILGVGRTLHVGTASYFGFTGVLGRASASGDSFGGGPVNPATSPFYNGGAVTTNFSLADPGYRILLLAKALLNITDCSIGAVNQILINLFMAPAVPGRTGNAYCTDGLNMTMTYTFDITPALTPVEHAIVYQSGVLPRPSGVFATVVEL
jgi:hypothetical protein